MSQATTDVTQLLTNDFGSWSTDPTLANYADPAYLEQLPRWQLVRDLRSGTPELRLKKEFYLPRFEAETLSDWYARVLMTFAQDHYASTLTEHVGLVMATPPVLDESVPAPLGPILEDVNGEGDHFEVFAQAALDAALHYGHAVLYTDYPNTEGVKTKADEAVLAPRPYVTLYPACDVLSARYAAVGGVKTLVHLVLRETSTVSDGEFGTTTRERFRHLDQAVNVDERTGRVIGLGAITWRLYEKQAQGEGFALTDEGTIVGPSRIPARVIYGGEKLGLMHSKPHLIGLAYTNIEETQVTSDYAAVMHKTNVPTPVFIGRQKPTPGTKETIQMGQGIDVPIGGDAHFMEPTGGALNATRDRINDLRQQMRRQGATMDDQTGSVKTAAEARLYAKQRNAKLTRAARSLEDALEGMLMDLAAFLQLPTGGEVKVNDDFAGEGLDPAYLTVLVNAYREGALPLEALLAALQTGKLPDDFKPEEEALQLIADQLAKDEQRREDEQARLDAQQPGTPADEEPAPPVEEEDDA